MQPKRWLLLILAVAVAARLGSALLMGDQVEILPGIYDQVSYHTLAIRLLGGHGFTFDQLWWPATPAGQPTAAWSYLYTFYLVGVYALFGAHPLAARLIQAVAAGIGMPWMVYRLAKRVFSSEHAKAETIGLLAAGWTAVYGYFVYYAGALMTETFYTIGILWILDCGLRIADCFKKRDYRQTARLVGVRPGDWIDGHAEAGGADVHPVPVFMAAVDAPGASAFLASLLEGGQGRAVVFVGHGNPDRAHHAVQLPAVRPVRAVKQQCRVCFFLGQPPGGRLCVQTALHQRYAHLPGGHPGRAAQFKRGGPGPGADEAGLGLRPTKSMALSIADGYPHPGFF